MSDRKGEKNIEGFLKYLERSAPVLEPSPYFAARVARIAMEQKASFADLIWQMGRWLVPSTLAVCTFAWIMILQGPMSSGDNLFEAEFLFEPEYASVEITYETVMGFSSAYIEQEESYEYPN
jgi:hypothetical protein